MVTHCTRIFSFNITILQFQRMKRVWTTINTNLLQFRSHSNVGRHYSMENKYLCGSDYHRNTVDMHHLSFQIIFYLFFSTFSIFSSFYFHESHWMAWPPFSLNFFFYFILLPNRNWHTFVISNYMFSFCHSRGKRKI